MDIFFTVANTIILIAIFWYQKSKNKVLLDRINSQKELVSETKSVVTQQAEAIKGQSSIVETALKYSERFDPDKLENIVKREISAEYSDELNKLKKNHEEEKREIIGKITTYAVEKAVDLMGELVKALFPLAMKGIATLPDKERLETISSLPESIKKPISDVFADIQKQIEDNENKSNKS